MPPPAPPIARVSPTASSSNQSLGSPTQQFPRALGNKSPSDAPSSDAWVDEDDTETQLQNAIAHIERLILRSRVGKSDTPVARSALGAAGVKAMLPGAGGEGAGSGGSGGATAQRAAEDADSAGGDDDALHSKAHSKGRDGPAGGNASVVRRSRLPPPLTDRSSMLTRRQSTNFFDSMAQPVHSARETASFAKAWDVSGAGKAGDGVGGHDDNRGHDWKRRSGLPKPTHLRRPSERWSWKGDPVTPAAEELVIGTPPTVEGSAESSSGSPTDG